jgi:hypothetical protein
MCLSRFVCFNRVCGFHVYNILIDYIFQVCVCIMFLYKTYVFMSRPCFKLWACFYIKAMFQYQWHVSMLSPCFSSRACFYIESMFQFKGMF